MYTGTVFCQMHPDVYAKSNAIVKSKINILGYSYKKNAKIQYLYFWPY